MQGTALSAGLAMLALASPPASGSVVTLGGPLSQLCYEAATSQDDRTLAIDGCSRALEEEALTTRDEAATFVNRGILYMTRHSDLLAAADFDSAIKLDEQLPDAWLNKGFLRLRQGNGREALALIQKGIDKGAGHQALALFARGVAYEQIGDYRSAYNDLTKAHDLAPGWALPSQYLSNYQVVSR